MNWRPDNWVNPYPVVKPIPKGFPYGSAYHRSLVYEAGADAMLRALRKEGIPAIDFKKGKYEGRFVLIPEDEEGKENDKRD